MPKFSGEKLSEIVKTVFKKAGGTDEECDLLADALVSANLSGVDSHGFILLTHYIRQIKNGEIVPGNKPKLVQETPTTALLDGNDSFGYVVAKKGMEIAIEKAKKMGVATVSLRNCTHIGRLGYYPLMAAKENMIGFITVLAGPVGAPYGGTSRVLGTNPLSFAIPGREFPFLLDMATTVHASGYILEKYLSGEKLPPGWMIGPDGKDILDPAVKYEQGPEKSASKIFGGYKGYALSLLVEILSGCLAGDGCSLYIDQKTHREFNPALIIVIDIAKFTSIDDFKERTDFLFKSCKNAIKAPGVDEILVTGEPEYKAQKTRGRDGIPIKEGVWKHIVSQVNEELGINLDESISGPPDKKIGRIA